MGLERVPLAGVPDKRSVDPADIYFLEADGGDTLVRLRGTRRLRDTRPLATVT